MPTRPAERRPLILAVEDDELIRSALHAYLVDVGFDVVEATNADEALALITQGLAVDLVLTDVVMPGTMNGDALADHILILHPGVPVILTSSMGQTRTLRSSQHRFLSKPYSLESVVEAIRELLPAHRPTSG